MAKQEFKATEAELMKAMASNASGNYNGQGDLALDYGDASNWGNENKSQRQFVFDLKNTGSADVTLALCPGSHALAAIKDANGNAVDAILKEGEVISDTTNADATKKLSAKGLPKSIDEFLLYVKNHPTRIHTMKFQVSDESVLSNPMYFKTITPFAGAAEFDQFTPANSIDENTQQSNRATCDLQAIDFQFNCDRHIVYTIPAGKTVQVTMLIGAISNESLELSRKASYGRIGALNS